MLLLETRIDAMCEFIKKQHSIDDIARKFRISAENAEYVLKVLERAGIVSLAYPPIGPATAVLTQSLPYAEEKVPRKYDEKFSLTVQGVPVSVLIYRDAERRPFYHVVVPRVGPYTRAFLDGIKADVAKEIPFEAHYFLTPERMQACLPEIAARLRARIAPYFSEDELDIIAGLLFIEMYGMGDIEILMADPALEEIAVNTATLPLSVYHRKHGWMKTNITIPDEEQIANIAAQIARRVGQQITLASPILDAFLTTGDRACATLYPVSTRGNTITIRKFAREPWTGTRFMAEGTINAEMLALLWQAQHYEMNTVVTGGTASGKTSTLNVLSHFIPTFQRVVTIEETRELTLPVHIWNWVPLLVRAGGPDGTGAISMADLLKTSLRLRPDRVLLGEVRTREEAEVLFDAMHTGHSVGTTIHADTATQMLRRLLEPPFSIPPTELEAIHLVVVQHRDRRRNIRRTYEISELVPSAEGRPTTNRIWIWRPRTDTFEQVNKPRRYIEEINLYTGMTERELLDDLAERVEIINWMIAQKYYDIKDVGEVMRMYYNLHDELIEKVKKGKPL